MKIAVAGSSGFIGRALVPFLAAQGHLVQRLVREPVGEAETIGWNPLSGEVEWEKLDGVEAVVNLAGANLAAGRWTPERKEEIVRSRVEATRTLVAIMTRMNHRPRVFVCASAVGFYGDRGDEVLTETSAGGNGFLAELCRLWEDEARGAEVVGIRPVMPRLGVVLGRDGGALAKMLPVFRAGLGGRLGNGRQWISWIAMEDLLGVFGRALADTRLSGPVNAVAPQAVRNAEFSRTLARAFGRWAVLPAPAPVLRMVLGEMADAALLASARVSPQKLLAAGFAFAQPDLADALQAAVGAPPRG